MPLQFPGVYRKSKAQGAPRAIFVVGGNGLPLRSIAL